MIYVIEGLDRCGKTTFIDILRSRIKNPNILVIHSGKPPKDIDAADWTLKYYNSLITKSMELAKSGYDIILDRSWLGESVYGPLYRNIDIGLPKLEHKLLWNENLYRMVVFTDSVNNLLIREDGKSLSSSVDMKEKEITGFKNAFDQSVISNKHYINWGANKFTTSFLNSLADKVLA